MVGKQRTIEDINQLVSFAQTFQDISGQQSQQHNKTSPLKPPKSEDPLDALASILPNGIQGEVYAVGVHVDCTTPTGLVTIVVASNYEIPDSVENYLRGVWVRLRIMGRNHNKNRRGNNLNHCQQVGFSREHRSLIRKIYSHCFARFKKRVLNGYHYMMELADSKEFKTFLKNNMRKSDKTNIYLLLDLVEEVGMKLEDFTPSEFLENDELLAERMEKFYQAIKKQRETLKQLDKLCDKLEFPPIQKYMDKVAALHGSIKVLVWYSRSPFIRRRMVVKRLTSESITVQPPTFDTCRKHIRKTSGIVNCYHDKDEIQTAANYVVRTAEERHRTDTNNHSVHPECKVLEYFSTRPFSSPPLRYIGASKVPCIACRSLFRAWNSVSPYRTYTCRGSWGKLYNWGFPRGLRARRRGYPKGPIHKIYKRIVKQITTHLSSVRCPVCYIRHAAQT